MIKLKILDLFLCYLFFKQGVNWIDEEGGDFSQSYLDKQQQMVSVDSI